VYHDSIAGSRAQVETGLASGGIQGWRRKPFLITGWAVNDSLRVYGYAGARLSYDRFLTSSSQYGAAVCDTIVTQPPNTRLKLAAPVVNEFGGHLEGRCASTPFVDTLGLRRG
jgi:hypothetical protein